jgi:MoxR-like ATPase
MPAGPHRFTFIGRGDFAHLADRVDEINPWDKPIGRWKRYQGDEGVEENDLYPNHPANYRAREDLADAVNTALALSKPLLLTGNPGTGKSQLAERIAWEFNLGPVLRFEAQSLSEANELFYRFDLVGHLAKVEMAKLAAKQDKPGSEDKLASETTLAPARFVKLGPLGEAIVRSNLQEERHEELYKAVFGEKAWASEKGPRPSVVLIDEIDKASRDFPNDLLNGIERLEFRIRELDLERMAGNPDRPPIVIITSNSERDLPAPFLRRCTFFHIADPTQEELVQIIAQRFFSRSAFLGADGKPGAPSLPPIYQQLLQAFWSFREQHEEELQYRPGTSELIDWTAALRGRDVEETADIRGQLDAVRKTASSVSKHKEDQRVLRDFLDGLKSNPV